MFSSAKHIGQRRPNKKTPVPLHPKPYSYPTRRPVNHRILFVCLLFFRLGANKRPEELDSSLRFIVRLLSVAIRTNRIILVIIHRPVLVPQTLNRKTFRFGTTLSPETRNHKSLGFGFSGCLVLQAPKGFGL